MLMHFKFLITGVLVKIFDRKNIWPGQILLQQSSEVSLQKLWASNHTVASRVSDSNLG